MQLVFQIVKMALNLGKLWVMKSGKRYGIWSITELWVFPANGIGGHQKSWVIRGYGFPQRWVMTESTVVKASEN